MILKFSVKKSQTMCSFTRAEARSGLPIGILSARKILYIWGNENSTRQSLVRRSSASEQSAEVFSLEETKFLKRKTVDTFNASAAIQSHLAPIKKTLAFAKVFFISTMRMRSHQMRSILYFFE